MLGDLGKLIVAKGFKSCPKLKKIARSGHTGYHQTSSPHTCSFDLNHCHIDKQPRNFLGKIMR